MLPNRLSGRLWRGTVPGRAPDGMVRALYMGTSTHAEDLALILPALEALAAHAEAEGVTPDQIVTRLLQMIPRDEK